MDTCQLDYACRSDPFIAKHFSGVFPYDKISRRGKAYIINSHPHNRKGEHWLGVWKSKKSLYFDSFGFAPYIPSVVRLLGKNFNYNKKRLQTPGTTVCGQYVLFFLYHASRGKKLPKASQEEMLAFVKQHFSLRGKGHGQRCCRMASL